MKQSKDIATLHINNNEHSASMALVEGLEGFRESALEITKKIRQLEREKQDLQSKYKEADASGTNSILQMII